MTDTPSDAYARINPDSPWRWVPYFTLTLMVFGLSLLSASDPSLSPSSMGIALAVLATAAGSCMWSYSRVGSQSAVRVACKWEEESGGVRVNSHPRLSIALRILGSVIAITAGVRTLSLIQSTLTLGEVGPAIPTIPIDRYLDTPLLWMLAFFFTIWGWQRPWDLKVVERAPDAA